MLLAYLLLGVGAGALAGFMGLGGGILMVPALAFLFEFTQREAQGISLAVMIPPIGIFAAYEYWRQGLVDVKVAIPIALGFMAGSWVTASFIGKMTDESMRRLFGLLVAFVAGQMVLGGLDWRKSPGAALGWIAAALGVAWAGGALKRKAKDKAASENDDDDMPEYMI